MRVNKNQFSFSLPTLRNHFSLKQVVAASLLFAFSATVVTALMPRPQALANTDRERASFIFSTRIDPLTLSLRADEARVEVVPDGVVAVGGPEASVQSRPSTYTIQIGDTLSEIAIQFGLSSFDIISVNKGLDRHQIKPGQVITIPETGLSDEQIAEIIAKEEAEAKQARQAANKQAANRVVASGSRDYIVPMKHRMITQYFGEGGHSGVDYAGPEGTPIYATGPGCIIHMARGWNGGYGTVLIHSLPGGKSALYSHLSRFAGVSQGDCVETGELIGYSGNTGRSTGPHLHFEIRVNGRPVNPLPYLKR